MLLPKMLRERLPGANIGFFLHIPFPSSEVFSILPWREEILEGLMGADLIGFHTPPYLRHFATSLRRVLGVDVDVDRDPRTGPRSAPRRLSHGHRRKSWEERAEQPDVIARMQEIRHEGGEKKTPRRYRPPRLHQGHPAPPARGRAHVPDGSLPLRARPPSAGNRPLPRKSRALRRVPPQIDELVGRINSTYGTPGWVPIHSLHRSLSEEEVTALYRAADVMLVTPLRDGMNLVAKEFVASRTDRDGVLVLSEFAGAASELGEALQVNPYDVDAMALRIRRALLMPAMERHSRMRALRLRVMSHDADRWSQSFLDAMRRNRREVRARELELEPTASPFDVAKTLHAARDLTLILDYDGTIMPFAATPDAAKPDADLLELLEELATRPGTKVHIVTGRARQSMERWLGHLPLGLHAEHGLWSRLHLGEPWILVRPVHPRLKDKVRPIFEHFTATTRGSFIEEKTASIAWHYRLATAEFDEQSDFGDQQAKELRLLLAELLSNEPMQVLSGSKVVEVRPMGVHKGVVVPLLLADANAHAHTLAIGDDRTDEDLFAALPPDAICMRVGDGPSIAPYRLTHPEAVRAFLRTLLLARQEVAPVVHAEAEIALTG